MNDDADHEFLARLSHLLDTLDSVAYIKDREGRYRYVNRGFSEVFRVSAQDAVGHTDAELFAADAAAEWQRRDRLVLDSRSSQQFEETWPLADGRHVFLNLKLPVTGDDGQPAAVCGLWLDITEPKRMEDALQRAASCLSSAGGERFFQQVVDAVAEILQVDYAMISVVREDDRSMLDVLAVHACGAAGKPFRYPIRGTPCQDVVGKSFLFVPSAMTERYDDAPARSAGVDGYAAIPLFDSRGVGLGLLAVMHREPIGSPGLFEATLRVFAERVVAEIERNRSEQALRASEEQYRSVFSSAADGLVLAVPGGRIVDANPAFCAMHGYSRAEVLGMEPREFFAADSLHCLDALLSALTERTPFRTEARRRRRDGTLFDAEVSGVPMDYRGQPHVLVTVRDVTERKRAELERGALEDRLRQAQKMEAVGHLAGGIAHDFNNILTSMTGYIILARDRLGEDADPALLKYLDRAERSGQRARDLIQQLLTFSRGQRGEPRPLALGPLLRESIKLLEYSFPASVELAIDIDDDVPLAMLDPVHVDQVLMNLCINARDAMQGSGVLRIRLATAGHEGVCASCGHEIGGRYIELAVADDGCGMSDEVRARMFDPFYSGKGPGKGTGMGLATVHGIVHEHGGHVLVDTRPAEGTTMRVVFPPLEAGPALTAARPAHGASERAVAPLSGRILQVDDERAVCEFMVDLLNSWGLEVRTASNGIEAVRLVADDPQAFDLAIVDQTMPRMTGLEAAGRILGMRPDLPVILYTGYSDPSLENRARTVGVRALVRKPLDVPALHRLLHGLLGTAPAAGDGL